METVPSAKLGGIAEINEQTLIIDGRNIYDAQEMKNLGFEYSCIGR